MALQLVFNDTFTEASDTSLTAHTPDTGLGWTALTNSAATNAIVSSAEGVLEQPWYAAAGNSFYVISVSESQNNGQAAELKINESSKTQVGVQLQDGATGVNGYVVEIDTGNVRLLRLDESVEALLVGSFETAANGDTLKITIDASGNLEVFHNTVSVITHTDATYTGGLPGVSINKTSLDNGDNFSAWLDDAGGGGDTTAPTFSVAPAVSAITTTTADLDATINETGDIHWVVVAQADAAPTITEIQAGQASGGGAPVASGSALAGTVLDTQITGLTASTAYAVYLVAQDDEATPNVQASATQVNFSTTAAATGTITTEAFKNKFGTLQTGLTNLRVVVLNLTTGAIVLNSTGNTTHATTAVLTLTDAAIVTGTTYGVVTISSDGSTVGIERIQAT